MLYLDGNGALSPGSTTTSASIGVSLKVAPGRYELSYERPDGGELLGRQTIEVTPDELTAAVLTPNSAL